MWILQTRVSYRRCSGGDAVLVAENGARGVMVASIFVRCVDDASWV